MVMQQCVFHSFPRPLFHSHGACINNFCYFSNCLQAPIQSPADTCQPISKRSLVLLDTEDHQWDPPWIQVTQHRVSNSFDGCVLSLRFFYVSLLSFPTVALCFLFVALRFHFCVGVDSVLFEQSFPLFVLRLDYATWRSNRSHVGTSSYAPSASKSTPGLVPHPPAQSLHGRRDWSAKYGHR